MREDNLQKIYGMKKKKKDIWYGIGWRLVLGLYIQILVSTGPNIRKIYGSYSNPTRISEVAALVLFSWSLNLEEYYTLKMRSFARSSGFVRSLRRVPAQLVVLFQVELDNNNKKIME